MKERLKSKKVVLVLVGVLILISGINLPARQFQPMNGLKGMTVVVQPFYFADDILNQITRTPFIDFISGDNPSLLGAFFEVSGPLDNSEVRTMKIQSLEAGPASRLKKFLGKGISIMPIPGKKK